MELPSRGHTPRKANAHKQQEQKQGTREPRARAGGTCHQPGWSPPEGGAPRSAVAMASAPARPAEGAEGTGSATGAGLAQGCLVEPMMMVCGSVLGCGCVVLCCVVLGWGRVPRHHAPPLPDPASGTFNPLCKVLCILQSLYLCAVGPVPVFCLARDTPRASNCSPKPLYSWMRDETHGAPGGPTARDGFDWGSYGTVALRGGPFRAWVVCGGFRARDPDPGRRERKHTHNRRSLHGPTTAFRFGGNREGRGIRIFESRFVDRILPTNTTFRGRDAWVRCRFTRRYWGNRGCLHFLH